jgi:hypothetical protein
MTDSGVVVSNHEPDDVSKTGADLSEFFVFMTIRLWRERERENQNESLQMKSLPRPERLSDTERVRLF